jgi:hypothetical protein
MRLSTIHKRAISACRLEKEPVAGGRQLGLFFNTHVSEKLHVQNVVKKAV